MNPSSISDALDLDPALRRALQAKANRGRDWARAHRDQIERAISRDLAGFVRLAWPVLEPGTAYVHGRVIEAICQHLEAVTAGEIKRLLITVPPGTAKSLLTSVFWPAWEWGPKGMPHHRFLSFSYSDRLSVRDSRRTKLVVQGDWYQGLWPLNIADDQNAKSKFENDKRGWRMASSIGGVGTGERADRLVCLPADEVVHTEHGPVPVGTLVSGRRRCRVRCRDALTGRTLLRPIIGWHRNPGAPIYELRLDDGSSLRCTGDHRLLTSNRGWVRADTVTSDDRFPEPAPPLDVEDQPGAHAVLPSQLPIGKGGRCDGVDLPSIELATAPLVIVNSSDIPSRFLPVGTRPDGLDGTPADPVASRQDIGALGAGRDLARLFLVKDSPRSTRPYRERAVLLGIADVLRSRSPREIVQDVLLRVAVQVARFHAGRSRAYERAKHLLVGIKRAHLAVAAAVSPEVAVAVVGQLEHPTIDAEPMSPSSRDAWEATEPSLVRDLVQALEPEDREPTLVRMVGHVPETFCITVEEHHNFIAGEWKGLIIANCDDPHAVADADSQAKLESTLLWFRETLPTRLNNPSESAIVVIMQRINQGDVAGEIISRELGYEHLCLPMRYEPERHCTTLGGRFTDWRTRPGQLLFPARYPLDVVEKLERVMGSYATSGQFQQAPSPRGGGLIPVDALRVVKDWPRDARAVRSWDLAATAEGTADDPDYTAGAKVAYKDGRAWIVDVSRDRLAPLAVEQRLAATAIRDGHGCAILVEREGGSSGKMTAEHLITRVLAGYEAREQLPTGSKIARSRTFAAAVEAGNVDLVEGPWNDAFVGELREFPRGRHDDQVDAAAAAFNFLASEPEFFVL